MNTVAEQLARIGIVTVSDRASRGVYADRGGPAIRAWLSKALISPWREVARVIADEQALIEQTLIELADAEACSLVVTTGGTGPAPRDVTPEATEAVCEKMLPGFGELMRAVSLKAVPTAILSRQTAGIRGRCLIVNLPGKPSAIDECLSAVFPAVPYCLDLIEGAALETDAGFCRAFRPPHAEPRTVPAAPVSLPAGGENPR
ncbi:MAG: molybdopterin adenylyltransferase [Candidatus Accumulibacter sp.]|jgi:molybdopterin adenylyltransferase|nr:molybdopterin adenylyltransferase [Accumulibacter sp.]